MGKHKNKKICKLLNQRLQLESKNILTQKRIDMIFLKNFIHRNRTLNTSISTTCLPEVVIYRSEQDYIQKCILEYPRLETGGQLFGYWTPKGRPVVLYAIGPGPHAGHHRTFFEQDIDYLDLVGNAIVKNFGLCHIGEWHSHHQLGLAQPSGYDASNMQNNVDRLNLNHFLLCIGSCNDREATLNPFIFYQGARQYLKGSWNEMFIDSPFRTVIDNALKSILAHPQTHIVNSTQDVTFRQEASPKPKIYDEGYWLNEKENGMVLKNIVDYIKDCNPGCNVEVKLENNTKYVHAIVNSKGKINHDIMFDKEFPNSPPRIIYNDIYFNSGKIEEVYKPTFWNFDGNIFTTFKNYYPHIR